MSQDEWFLSLGDDDGEMVPAGDVQPGTIVLLRDLEPDGPGRYGVIDFSGPLSALAVIDSHDPSTGRSLFTIVSSPEFRGQPTAFLLAHYITEAPSSTLVFRFRQGVA